jgi:hypothetical protein
MTTGSMPLVKLVTAERISGSNAGRATSSRIYTGILIKKPVVGEPVVIFRDPDGRRMTTSPVQRVLSDPDGDTLWVETMNSTYRLSFPTL